MTTAVLAKNRVLHQIADTLWALGEGNNPSFVEADALAAIEAELPRTRNVPLRNLLQRVKTLLEVRAKVSRLEAEIKEQTALLHSLQKQLLARQQLKYLSSDIHQALAE